MAAPRKYPDELRERAVRLAMDQAEEGNGRAVFRRVGVQLGINPETLRGWVRQAQIDEGQRPGTTTSDAQRVRELESEFRERAVRMVFDRQAAEGGPRAASVRVVA
ncbi:transposase [Kocuria palustris]|uniref:transposase n=1 Tax=Kocuria palustris TaxID=71999 RepID=UPI0024692E57|nr:transposase [Kocuria palustris]MDH5152734.1 transposase [Kocuria palustris]